jgi:hypothetical protein
MSRKVYGGRREEIATSLDEVGMTPDEAPTEEPISFVVDVDREIHRATIDKD